MTERERYQRAVGNVLRSLRLRTGVSIAQLATAWKCHPSNVTHAEKGRNNITAEQLRLVAALTGATPSEILDEVARELDAGVSGLDGGASAA